MLEDIGALDMTVTAGSTFEPKTKLGRADGGATFESRFPPLGMLMREVEVERLD